MSERQRFEGARRALSVAHERNGSLCEPFLDVLPVSGASLSILGESLGQSTVSASDAIAVRLDELQFDLGEGPCWQALATRRPVIALDLHSTQSLDWPIFADALRSDSEAGQVESMFAFPLVIGSLGIGAVDLFMTSAGGLTESQVADATALANIAAWQVLRGILSDRDPRSVADSAPSRREVHQATGMVLAQLNVSADDAALLIRAHAYASGRSVKAVATDIIERRLNFSSREQP